MTTKYTLRPYQQEAVDAVIEYIKKNTAPACLEVATGGGKAIICAELARLVYKMSGKRILILVPTAELVKQNKEAFDMTGYPSSIYSASVSKSLRHHVVFATPLSFKKVAKRIGGEFSLIIQDECHLLSPTYKSIYADMMEGNPNLRIIGMSASPYKLNTGYVYEIDEHDNLVEEANNPYFKKLLYRIDARLLISLGYLTPPSIGDVSARYDTSNMELNSYKEFTQESIDRAFVGKGRLTSQIVADIVDKSKNARCVMIFAATVAHAIEVMESLPKEISRLVTGETPKKERDSIMKEAQQQKIKYLVNCSVLTTGVSINHVDVVAILRKSTSHSLITQIVGRGMRLCDNKPYFLLLDYANNVTDLFPDGDIFNPDIKTYRSKESIKIDINCPECGSKQKATKRQGYDLYNDEGFALDLAGDVIMIDGLKLPAHYSRRCTGVSRVKANEWKRCDFYWASKPCPKCDYKNDVAARFCGGCNHELIDPNKSLSEQAIIVKQGEKYTTTVSNLEISESRNGGVIIATFSTPNGLIKSKFYPNNPNRFIAQHANIFNRATECGEKRPTQIEYSLKKDGLYVIHRYIPPFVEN